MSKIVTGLFRTWDEANAAKKAIGDHNFRHDVDTNFWDDYSDRNRTYDGAYAGADGTYAGDRTYDRNDKDFDKLIDKLTDRGVPRDDARCYAEGVRRGGFLVTAVCHDEDANECIRIMNDYGALDMAGCVGEWRGGGWEGELIEAEPYATYGTEGRYEEREGRTVIPEVREDVSVSTRPVSHGGVRIYSRVHEEPIEKQVTLREEHVNVERRDVDRPLTDRDMDAFREGAIEMTETAEEPVIRKTAHVTGEVVVDKDVEEHTETVRDTVRRTEVEVDRDIDRDRREAA